MDCKRLFDLAVLAFDDIERNTGSRIWTPAKEPTVESVKAALAAFETLVSLHGLAWLIDSTIGTGMSHLGFSYWLRDAASL